MGFVLSVWTRKGEDNVYVRRVGRVRTLRAWVTELSSSIPIANFELGVRAHRHKITWLVTFDKSIMCDELEMVGV